MSALSFTDALGFLVRNVIRQVYGMAANSVRPANQAATTGTAGEEFATVLLSAASSAGWPNVTVTPDSHGALVYALETLKDFVASVQFFKAAGSIDGAGIPAQSDSAFDKALRLGDVLQLPPWKRLLNQYGLGFVRVEGEPHNLAALVSALWESRGHVDLRFCIVSQESASAAIMQSVNIGLYAAQGAALVHQSLEVST